MEARYSDVVFAAPSARVVETDRLLYEQPDGTVRVESDKGFSPGFGKGAVYTVTSRSLPVTEATLRAADATPVPPPIREQYAQDPTQTTARVRELARQITAGAPTTYDKVRAIESWMGANTKYSLNAPLSPPGVDVVDDFLFHTHLGWCEQIASSLVVLARSVGIPARLVTGFVPGTRDGAHRAVRGPRERRARVGGDLLPGYRLAGLRPDGLGPARRRRQAGRLVVVGRAPQRGTARASLVGLVLAAAIATPEIIAYRRRRLARRASWSAAALHRLERVGRKAGRARAPAETPREYACALAERLGDDRLAAVGETLDAELYSPRGAPDSDRAEADAVLTSL